MFVAVSYCFETGNNFKMEYETDAAKSDIVFFAAQSRNLELFWLRTKSPLN